MSSYMKKHIKLSNCYTCNVGPNSMIAPPWRIWVSFRGFFWRWCFCMVKYLSFHNSSSFALRYFLKCKWQGHSARDTTCYICMRCTLPNLKKKIFPRFNALGWFFNPVGKQWVGIFLLKKSLMEPLVQCWDPLNFVKSLILGMMWVLTPKLKGGGKKKTTWKQIICLWNTKKKKKIQRKWSAWKMKTLKT
jgi:hypothetical protein